MKEIEYLDGVHTHTISERKRNGKTYYVTRLDNRKEISATSAIKLQEKLLNYYRSKEDYSFETIYQMAQDEHYKITTTDPETRRSDDSNFRRWIDDDFKKRDVRDITPNEVSGYIVGVLKNYAETNGKRATPHNLCDIKHIFNRVFEYASSPEHRIIDYNPVEKDNSRYRALIDRRKPKAQEKAFQPEDLGKIEKECLKRSKQTYPRAINAYAILVSMKTGLRIGELAGLRWSDIEENVIHVQNQLIRQNHTGKTTYVLKNSTKDEKNSPNGGRYVTSALVTAYFAEIRIMQENEGIKSEWVFARADGSYMTSNAFNEALMRLTKKLGIELSNNHAFRMAFNSYTLIPAGVNVADRAKMLGHSIKVNEENYTFESKNYAENIGEKLLATKSAKNDQKSAKIVDISEIKKHRKAR